MPDPTTPFHASQGWFFNRGPDGSVTVRVGNDNLEVTANTWASIVAHVCAQGENSETFHAALAFHEREPSPTGPEET